MIGFQGIVWVSLLGSLCGQALEGLSCAVRVPLKSQTQAGMTKDRSVLGGPTGKQKREAATGALGRGGRRSPQRPSQRAVCLLLVLPSAGDCPLGSKQE